MVFVTGFVWFSQVAKCGSRLWSEVTDLSRLIREGETKWEDLDLDDVEVRMKWAGMFHRKKRQPGTFMMRFKVDISGVFVVTMLTFCSLVP